MRLARLWEAAPEQASAVSIRRPRTLASRVLDEHGVAEEARNQHKRPTGALLTALKDVKQTRVTLPRIGRVRGSAWVTRGVQRRRCEHLHAPEHGWANVDAGGHHFRLAQDRLDYGLHAEQKVPKHASMSLRRSWKTCRCPVSVEDVVSAISFVWSVSFNSGNLLNNDDLMKGEAIRPMAANISENWTLRCGGGNADLRARERARAAVPRTLPVGQLAGVSVGVVFRRPALAAAAQAQGVGEGLRSITASPATLDALMDRWLICSQWADVWSFGQRAEPQAAMRLASPPARWHACAKRRTSPAPLAH